MQWITWTGLHRRRDVGLLVFRVGLGASMMAHGWPKFAGGPDLWARLGGAMAKLGITFAPTFWGFMAAFAEFVGGALLIFGLATRPVAAMLCFTMFVAAFGHYVDGDGFRGWSHAAEVGIAFFAMLFVGPGRYSVDARIHR